MSAAWERALHVVCGACVLMAALLLIGFVESCARTVHARQECGGCHAQLEAVSSSHSGCSTCHGGDAGASRKDLAHRQMHGSTGETRSALWEKGCGSCHQDQYGRMLSSQMYSNAGMIRQIQKTWEGERDGQEFAAVGGAAWNARGQKLDRQPVAGLPDLSGELYRKFCSRCHLAAADDLPDTQGHPSGCAACHFPFGEGDRYSGSDLMMFAKDGYSATHRMQGLPPMSACVRCHHRSGRTALSYQGLQDGNNALVATNDGLPGPVRGTDERTFSHIVADVHFEAGMECIDCHTSREVMGDGYSYGSMAAQLEIACEDCHGGADQRPRFVEITRESDSPILESRQYATPLSPGTRVALTKRGRPYSNVIERGGEVLVLSKRSGKALRSRVITGTAAHTIVGHQRLECIACHSRAVPQCYGCHTKYDKREDSWDFVLDEDTPGAFSETEDYRKLYPFPLALNGLGGIAPVTPGCQTFVTVVEADGSVSRNEAVTRYRGKPQLRFAPFYAHNTGRRAVGCADCHGDPAFLGFGQHVIENGSIRSTLLCERNPRKGLDAFLSMDGGRVVSHAAIARDGARALDDSEVRRALAVNLCITCHPKAGDPIYRKRLDHDALDDALHRRLLSAR